MLFLLYWIHTYFTDSKFISFFSLLVATEECGKVLITPIKRQIDESWKDLSTNELVDLNGKWDVGQPNGQELQECAFFNLNTGNFYDDTCSTKVCFVCAWSYKPKFLLKGLCSDSKIDHQYVLVPKPPHDGHVIFSGYERNYIIFNKELSSWLITDTLPAENVMPENVFGSYKPDAFTNQLPTGKKIWQLTEEGCNGTLPLKLTHVRTFYPIVGVTRLTWFFEINDPVKRVKNPGILDPFQFQSKMQNSFSISFSVQ